MLTVRQLCMRFTGGVTALHACDLEFRKGDFTVLLGPSGAGKSTLLRCLNLLNVPSEGYVEVEGIGRLDSSFKVRLHRKHTGMIFQQHQLIPRLSALQNVLMGRLGYHHFFRSIFSFPREEKIGALECLERVGLLEKALTRVDQLSGGEQQRVGIARALVQNPQIILADEPIASLDPAKANRLMKQLHEICKEDGISAIVSLHQVAMARRYADRIIGISKGKVVFDGESESLSEEALEGIYGERIGEWNDDEKAETFSPRMKMAGGELQTETINH